MKRKNALRNALFTSILSLLLCVSMLVSTTFAWFTDEVKSGKNVIAAGNLDIELEYSKIVNGQATAWAPVKDAEELFDKAARWEPGHAEVVYLRMANKGSLALKYQLGVNIAEETAGTNVYDASFMLSDYIYMAVVEGTDEPTYATREEAIKKATELGATAKINAGYTDAGIMLAGTPDVFKYLALVVYMPEDTDNNANYKIGTTAPSITLGVNLFATQYTEENDSFGKDYDDGAYIAAAPEAVPESGAVEVKGSDESNLSVIVPENVVNNLPAEVTSLAVNASAPIVDTQSKTVNFSTVELVDQNGNEVDIAAAGGKVTVVLSVGGAFADGEQVDVYHDGSFVTSAVVANGKVSYETSHFCAVSVQSAEEVVLDNTIDTVKEFVAFAAAVNAGNSYAGQTVTLGADLDLDGVTWTPIGTASSPFKGTFDGNGKTIKNLSVLMAGQSDVGLFGFTTDGEVKNVTVENAKIAGRLNVGVVAGTPYTTKYTNITVKGLVEVDGLAYVGAVGGKNAYANWTDITVDATAKSYVKADSRENGKAYRTYVGGVVGFNGEGGHTFTNITSNINVFGSTCDVGGAFGIAHYGNKFVNVTVTGNVEIYATEDAADAEEMGGIAGVWHNENGTSVTFTGCTFKGKLTANKSLDLYNNTIVGAAYNASGNGTLVIDGEAYVAVNTGDEFKAALAEDKNVIFVADITMAATETNAYGKTGVNVKNGQTIDGNGFTLKVTGAGGTWDSAISTTGGIIKNLTVAQGFRGIFVNHNSTYSETVVLDNVTVNGPVYSINCDQGTKQNMVATNCTINGWTSFATTIGTVTFENCAFGQASGYAFCRPYAATEFVSCTFSEGYTVDTSYATVTFTDCANPNA